MCGRFGTRKIETSGYNPTGNASVERFHRYFMASLSILHDRQDVDNDTTGFSPFFLETGRHPNLPAGNPKPTGEKDEEGWAVQIVDKLKRAFEHTREAQVETAMKNRERSTRNCTNPNYEVGDMLYLWEKSSEESRLRHEIREIEGHKGGKLPSKLVNRGQDHTEWSKLSTSGIA